MTNTTTVVDELSEGSYTSVVADVDITSLGSAGTESFDPATEFGLSDCHGGTVLQQENGGYAITVAQNNDITAKYADNDAGSDGTLIDVPSNTDVGVVRIKFEGNRGP